MGEEGPGGDVIVAEFRDGGTVRIVQHGFVALVIHLRDGGERQVTDQGSDRPEQVRRRNIGGGIGAEIGLELHAVCPLLR